MHKYHTNQTTHFKSITLLVKDIEKQTKFYSETLGLHLLSKDEKQVVLSADKKNPMVTLITNDDVVLAPRTLGLYHVAFLFKSEIALSLVFNRLIKNKYPITGASDHGVSHALYLNDPEENGIELYFDLEDQKWPKINGQIDMYTKELDYQALAHLTCTPGNEFEFDSETIIGHLHFYVNDLVSANQYYVNKLGFDVIQNYFSQALFVSSASYHHHLGLNTWMRGALIRRENETGLVSYVVSIPSAKFDEIKSNLEIDETHDMPQTKDILNQVILFDVK